MNDKELLEMAAKAAGYDVSPGRNGFENILYKRSQKAGSELFYYDVWNPLDDSGEALCLAIDLGLLVDCDDSVQEVEAVLAMTGDDSDYVRCSESYGQGKHAATRRAIVRAAAQIGWNKL